MNWKFIFAVGLLAGWAGAAGAPPTPPPAALPASHVFFFDVSGSTKDVYGAKGSAKRSQLAEGLFASGQMFRPGQPISVYEFTTTVKRVPGTWSPDLLKSHLNDKMTVITNGDTNLIAVLDAARGIAESQPHRLTFAWILTDNINDPKGSGGDAKQTQDFYTKMFEEPSPIRRVYFFPISKLKLVLYAFVMSDDPKLGGMDLDRFENSLASFGEGLKAPRIRAKPVGGERPLEIDASSISFEGPNPNATAEIMGAGRHTSMLVRGVKEGQPLAGTFRIRLRSRFDEWRIRRATVERTSLDDLESVDFPNVAGKVSAMLTPSGISVDPRSASSILYQLQLGQIDSSPTPKAPFFTLAAFNPDSTGTIHGRLTFRISQADLEFKLFNHPKQTAEVQEIFHLSDIGYFVHRDQGRATRLDFSMPVDFEVKYNYVPRWIATGLIGLVLCGASAFLLLGSRRSINVRLHGLSPQPFRVDGGHPVPISPAGTPLARIETDWKGTLRCKPLGNGVLVNGHRGAIALKNGMNLELSADGATHRYRVEIINSATPPRAATGSSSPGGIY
jgi:hypothetical protein